MRRWLSSLSAASLLAWIAVKAVGAMEQVEGEQRVVVDYWMRGEATAVKGFGGGEAEGWEKGLSEKKAEEKSRSLRDYCRWITLRAFQETAAAAATAPGPQPRFVLIPWGGER